MRKLGTLFTIMKAKSKKNLKNLKIVYPESRHVDAELMGDVFPSP